MAYVIGSQKGKDIAKNMKTGETYKASDGSTWTKKSDGSVSVTEKNGATWNNAYTSSGGGGNKGGGGGGSNKNSQYTNTQYTPQYVAPTLGNTYDNNTDYQAIINNAVANKDYVTAAKAEQLRNQKIIGQGLNYDLTNNYKGWLDTRDYSKEMIAGMGSGMSAQDMNELINGRYGKADGTIGLDQYKDDALMEAARNYVQQQLAYEQQQAMWDQWNEDHQKEEYTRPYDPQIDALLNQILNRDDFSYDAMNDPLYQQYAKMYQREGDRAMKETMAEAAAGAGGMNTYAVTAAQQANSYYNSQLNDKIPQLYQLAYDMYLNDKESKVQDLGILQNMDATQYNRYRDTINDYYADKNFAYNAYKDAVQQGNWQQQFNYNAKLDKLNNDWKNKEWEYGVGRDTISDNRYENETEYNRNQAEVDSAKETIRWYIENDVSADAIPKDLIEKAGYDQNAINQMIAQKQAEIAARGYA